MRPHVLDKLNGEQENDPKTKFEKIWKEMKEFIKNDVIRNLELNFYLDITL
jgi:L-rhamnose mutarotase